VCMPLLGDVGVHVHRRSRDLGGPLLGGCGGAGGVWFCEVEVLNFYDCEKAVDVPSWQCVLMGSLCMHA
jgi:hypothetical protein